MALHPFEEMLKVVPPDLRANVERLLRGFGITNNDDPVVQLMTILALYAAYYDRIPDKIVDASRSVEKLSQATEERAKGSLDALDQRVRLLRDLTVLLQKVTDRLTTVPREIAERFPIEALSDVIFKKLEAELAQLNIPEFRYAIVQAQTTMQNFAIQSAASIDQMKSDIARLTEATEAIKKMHMPRRSWWSFF